MGKRTLLEGTRDFSLGKSHREFPIGKMDHTRLYQQNMVFMEFAEIDQNLPFLDVPKGPLVRRGGQKPPKRRYLMVFQYGNACFGSSGQILGNQRY